MVRAAALGHQAIPRQGVQARMVDSRRIENDKPAQRREFFERREDFIRLGSSAHDRADGTRMRDLISRLRRRARRVDRERSIAPAERIAMSAMSHSTRFSERIATRSPGLMPSWINPPAAWSVRLAVLVPGKVVIEAVPLTTQRDARTKPLAYCPMHHRQVWVSHNAHRKKRSAIETTDDAGRTTDGLLVSLI